MACAHRSPEENRTAACLRRVKPAVKRRSPAHPRPGIVPLPHPRLRLYILHAAQRDTVSGRKRSKPGYDTARRITQCLIARTAVLRGTAHQIAFGFSKITPRLRIPHPGATEQGRIVFGAGAHLFDLGARGDMPAEQIRMGIGSFLSLDKVTAGSFETYDGLFTYSSGSASGPHTFVRPRRKKAAT